MIVKNHHEDNYALYAFIVLVAACVVAMFVL